MQVTSFQLSSEEMKTINDATAYKNVVMLPTLNLVVMHQDLYDKLISNHSKNETDHSHYCRMCLSYYTPAVSDITEDCPFCGYDGK
jgi:rubrerythrin